MFSITHHSQSFSLYTWLYSCLKHRLKVRNALASGIHYNEASSFMILPYKVIHSLLSSCQTLFLIHSRQAIQTSDPPFMHKPVNVIIPKLITWLSARELILNIDHKLHIRSIYCDVVVGERRVGNVSGMPDKPSGFHTLPGRLFRRIPLDAAVVCLRHLRNSNVIQPTKKTSPSNDI
jgi:hypothetical protein